MACGFLLLQVEALAMLVANLSARCGLHMDALRADPAAFRFLRSAPGERGSMIIENTVVASL